MTRFTALLAAAVVAASPVAAIAQTPDAAPTAEAGVYQVLRAGDRQLSCDALGAEANTLTAELAAEQQDTARKAKKAKTSRGLMGGIAGGVLGGAARYGLARGMVGGALSPMMAQAAVAATDSASIAAGQAIASGGDDGASAAISPRQQRLDHLVGLYREKQC